MSRQKKDLGISEEAFAELVKNSFSYRNVGRELGLCIDGQSYMRILKRWISERNLDTSHFTGMIWSKGSNSFEDSRLAHKYDSTKLGLGKSIKTSALRNVLLNELHFVYECSVCKLNSWQEKDITLQIDHIDGDYSNSSPSNLRFVCPNCHSQTSNYAGKNIRKKTIIPETELVEALKKTNNIRQALIEVGLTPKGANYNRAYSLCAKYKIDIT